LVPGIAVEVAAILIAVTVFLAVWIRRRMSSALTDDLPSELPAHLSSLELEPVDEHITHDNPLLRLGLTEQQIVLRVDFVE
jgi:hypothetical protein